MDGTSERQAAAKPVLTLQLMEETVGQLSYRYLEVVTWETERRALLLREAYEMLRALIEGDPGTRGGRPMVPPPLDFQP